MADKPNSKAISLAAMERILKKSGAERISDRAKLVLSSIIEEIGEDMGRNAVRFAEHAGRRTVKKEDIKLASKK